MSDAFRLEYDPIRPTATIVLNRPDDGNRLAPQDMLELGLAISKAGRDLNIKLVLIRGEGEHFCLGRKLAEPPATPPSALELRERITKPILDVYENIRATPVPVVALVHGDAEGFGCAMIGQCDLAIAADHARFCLPEMDNNLPPTLAISALLHKIPRKQLMHIVYTRDRFSAAQALTYDMVTQVVPAEDFDAAVAATIDKLADRSRRALCAVKEYMGIAPYSEPQTASRLAANILATVFSSPEDVD